MANRNAPKGLVPVNDGGMPCSEPLVSPYKGALTAAAMARGDLAAMDSDGAIVRAAAASTQIVGVFWGCRYTDANGKLVYSDYKPASQTNYDGSQIDVFIVDGSQYLFAIQCDATAAVAISQTTVGMQANHTDTAPTRLGAGGHSNHTLDNNTLTATADPNLTFRVRKLFKEVGMVFSTTESDSRYAWVVVQINEHALRGAGNSVLGGQTPAI